MKINTGAAEKCDIQFKKVTCHSLESPEKEVSMGDCGISGGPVGQAMGIACCVYGYLKGKDPP